jgi:hypothetical protein
LPEAAAAAPIRPRAFFLGAALVSLVGKSQPYVALVLRSYYGGGNRELLIRN